MLQGVVEKGGELCVEVVDINESKELLKFCCKFIVLLCVVLCDVGVLVNYEMLKCSVVYVFFIVLGCCYIGYLYSNNNLLFYMGILCLKFLVDVLSCFMFKLEEVFYVFIFVDEWDECLVNGMWVVDLGVCFGGWIY